MVLTPNLYKQSCEFVSEDIREFYIKLRKTRFLLFKELKELWDD